MQDKTRVIVEIALTIALAAVLNSLQIFQMPQGGNVSLGMLPIIVLALRRGVGIGILSGALYGFVDLMLEPFILTPVQVVLDYPLAYAAVGLAGLGASRWQDAVDRGSGPAGVIAAIAFWVTIGVLGRYGCHVLSGYVFFAEYAPAGQPVLLYSALYNTYVLVSGAACLAAAGVVLPALSRLEPARTSA